MSSPSAPLPYAYCAKATRIAAILGALAIALGAFGAHALKARLEQNGTTAIWQTAVFYHAIHAVMLYAMTQATQQRKFPFVTISAGVIVFSGSLYVMALTNARWLGAITPIGGVSLIAGWVALAWPRKSRNTPGGSHPD